MEGFRTALGRIGFNPVTRQEIIDNGFTSISSLSAVSDDDIGALVKHIGRWKGPSAPVQEGQPPPEVVNLPFISVKKLHAMRKWVLYQKRKGTPVNAAHCTNEQITLMTERTTFLTSVKNSEDSTPKVPDVLSSFTQWRTWWESWNTYTKQLRGANEIPLSYIHRKHTLVTPEILGATYTDTDAEFCNTFALDGVDYKADVKRYYDTLKPLLINGPGWTFIRPFDKANDGRGAITALVAQAEGDSSRKIRSSAAYHEISAARYRGPTRNFTLDNYITKHADAHAELLDLGEVISESKKVDDFLKGILDPRLKTAKENVLGDSSKYENFNIAQQYFKTVCGNMTEQDKSDRLVSALERDEGGRVRGGRSGRGRGRQGRGRGRGGARGLALNSSTSYSNAIWKGMSDEQRDKVTMLRKRSSEAKARKAAAASSDGSTEVAEDKPADDAGNQFGRNSHKKARA